MKHDTRRSLRILITLLHLIIQLILLWLFFDMLGTKEITTDAERLEGIYRALTQLGLMIGAFASYFSIMKLLSRRNLPARE